ncbi:LOW QUALITY PROTEIN: zinc finger protein 800-like [Dermacentor silvarum]|uniref:LOW QUALITY PROTEIN: zinc finger protein 800-like n=1 Tax=Dermacentor silvarum TaxID=543639 RepID=UPI0018974B2D|nr:LOW QUALITY PROTEIN: zinc finger protein 800-like [Dermacentor silvarum]
MASSDNNGATAPKVEDDHSVLQRPIALGVQGVRQIMQCMSGGSREVKDVLLNECSVLFECKVCRSLFRSLANLLAHKRVYCTQHLCEAMPLCALSAPSEEPTPPTPPSATGELQLTPIAGTTSAVYQRVHREDEQPPLDKGPSSSQATSSRTSYLSARSDCDLSRLACLNCDTTYTSVKTLYLHMVSLHSTTRRYYPCPLCRASFVQMWGVTRHLVSVHGQTKEQIVQLRDSIRGGVQLRKSRLQHMVDCLLRNNGTAAVCSRCSRPPAACPCHRVDRPAKKARRKGVPRRRPLVSNPDRTSGSGAERTVQQRSANKRVSPAMERKILAIIDYDRLACLRCERLFSSFSSLRRHAAVHLGYSRYQCTRCSYQSYNRADCRSHVQRVHADAAHDAERMIVHVPGEEEGGHPMATRFPRLDSLSTLVTRSGAYPKRPPPLGPQK